MSPAPVELKSLDRLEVTTVVNNYADLLLPEKEGVIRPAHDDGKEMLKNTLLAEHGLCLWLDLFRGGAKTSVLLDTGYSRVAALHNMKLLGLDPNELSALVISHGHMDHTGSVMAILDRIREPIELILHPDAFLTRVFKRPDGSRVESPSDLIAADLEAAGARLRITERPYSLAGGGLATTGRIPRRTGFETVTTNFLIRREGKTFQDTINDDLSLMAHIKGSGLALISGCAHSGIINSIEYARELSGLDQVEAVIGGFHLTGAEDGVIQKTVDLLKGYSPGLVMAMHCTGRRAEEVLSGELPDSFVLNSVGTKLVIGG